MKTGLGWLGVAVGLAGFVASHAVAGKSSGAREEAKPGFWMPYVVFVAATTLTLWAIAMQRGDPFSTGQSLGYGLLIGGLAGAAAGVAACRIPFGRMAATGSASFGLFGASLVYLIFHGDPQPAMLGFAAGAVMGEMLASSLENGRGETFAFGAFSLALALGVVFAVNHFNEGSLRLWWPLPLLIGATVCLAAFAGTLLTARTTISALISCVILLGLAAIYGARVFDAWSVLWTAAAGVLCTALTAWVTLTATRTEDKDGLARAGAVSAVLAVAFVVVAFKLWAGLGIALGVIAAWAVLLPLMGRDTQNSTATHAVRGIVLVGSSVVLFRLFIELYKPELGGTDPRIHYTFIGTILGALMPRVLSAVGVKNADRPWLQIGGAAFVGLVAALSPAAILVVWEIKAVLGLVLGTTIATVINYVKTVENAKPNGRMVNETVYALAAQLSAVILVRPLMVIELTRAQRAITLGVVAAAAVAWLLVSGAISRRSSD